MDERLGTSHKSYMALKKIVSVPHKMKRTKSWKLLHTKKTQPIEQKKQNRVKVSTSVEVRTSYV